MKEYILQSRERNSFHFRLAENPESFMESFTVSYAVDGTACMTGDMRDLVWRRNYYPNGEHDYGFPFDNTYIGYFAEKIIPELKDSIKEFDSDLAVEELEEHFSDEEEYTDEERKDLQYMIRRNRWEDYSHSPIQQFLLYKDLCKTFPDYEWGEYNFGMKYTDKFLYQFELLKMASKIITKTVKR